MFSRNAVAEMLARTPSFSKMATGELRTISECVERRVIEPGATITRQGAFGDEMVLVIAGHASIDVSDTIVGVVGPGDVIGEMALLDHGPRSATIVATTPMELGVLSIRSFDELTRKSPAIWRVIATGLARRLREADRTLCH